MAKRRIGGTKSKRGCLGFGFESLADRRVQSLLNGRRSELGRQLSPIPTPHRNLRDRSGRTVVCELGIKKAVPLGGETAEFRQTAGDAWADGLDAAFRRIFSFRRLH